MSVWDGTSHEARDNLLRVVDAQAQDLFAMAAAPGAWEAPTLSTQWQVRDVVGHLIDVTESYFAGFEAARAGETGPDALGTQAMQESLDMGARGLRELEPAAALARLKTDYAKMVDIVRQLSDEEWQGLIVPHKYMGPLPAFFYPVFQLMDYGVHSWDIRQGSGRAHCLNSDVADLLAPFMFVLWSATANVPAELPPCEIGVKILSGHNAGSWKVTAGPEAITYASEPVDNLATVLEFDPGSFVLTAFGRSNAGTVRGDATIADRYLNMFFRI